jgi:regulator of replication initiation timing
MHHNKLPKRKDELIRSILDSQDALIEISLKCEDVKTEIKELTMENDQLKLYIDSLIARRNQRQ